MRPNVKVTGRRRQATSARAGETVPRTTGPGAGGLPLALRLTDKLGSAVGAPQCGDGRARAATWNDL